MKIHVCTGWGECACWRLNISAKRYWIGIALTPGSRFASKLDGPATWLSVHKK